MERETLITLTADIVAAHVSNNNVAIGDVGTLVQRVHEALNSLEGPSEEDGKEKVPVVSVRSSVKPDYLICMECGKKQKTLKRHLATAHGMTPEQYRQDYGLPATYPMTAPNYSKRRSEMAQAIGLGRRPRGEGAKAQGGGGKGQNGGEAKKPAARRGRKKSEG